MLDQEYLDKAKELESMFTEVFTTDAGKIVLKELERAFECAPIASDTDLYRIGVRDGRRDALYQIKKQIKGM